MTGDKADPKDSDEDSNGSRPATERDTSEALGQLILKTRWLQLPLTVGLTLALIVLEIKFFESLFSMVWGAIELTKTGVILIILDLIDMVLIANLLVMIITGGYKMFISPFRLRNDPRIPDWLAGITLAGVKFRIAATVLLVATIHILHEFLEPTVESTQETILLIGVQLVFVITVCAYAWIERLERLK